MENRTFVAREQQLQELEDKLALSLEGQGQIGFVSGEAGAGKTALVHHFIAQAQDKYPDLLVTLGNCNAHTGIGDPYLPFREALGLLVGIVEGDSGRETITQENGKRIKHFMAESGRILVEVAPDLVGAFVPGGAILSAIGRALAVKTGIADKLDDLRKQEEQHAGIAQSISDQNQVFERFSDYLQAVANKHPLILVIDDLHWTDTASAGLLFHLSRRNEKHPIFIVGTYRPTETLTSTNGSHPLLSVLDDLKRYYGNITIDLDELAKAEDQLFVNQLIDSEPNQLGKNFRQKMLEKTGGQPLFTVELLRLLQESGGLKKDTSGNWVEDSKLDWKSLPTRVEGVISGRINRLDSKDRELLNVASIQGEEFLAEIVARVLSLEDKEVMRRLSGDLSKTHKIVHFQSLQNIGDQQLSTYQFEHNLFQQYLIGGIDPAQKQILHKENGTELETIYGEEVDRVAPQLASHFMQAGAGKKAVRYLIKAGDWSRELIANGEAIAYYREAVKLLETQREYDRASRTMIKIALTLQGTFDFIGANQAFEEAFVFRQKASALSPGDPLPVPPHSYRIYRNHRTAIAYPGMGSFYSDAEKTRLLFSGMLEEGPNNVVLPDGAEKWESDNTGKVYTFYLNKEVRWSDGIPVTSTDYLFAWKRLLQSPIPPLAVILKDVQYARAFVEGTLTDSSKLGIRALDDYTLEVELEHPVAYFLLLLAGPHTFPLPQHAIKKYGDAWIDPKNFVGNGPFQLESIDKNKKITYVRNPTYAGFFPGNIERIEMINETSELKDLDMYRSDELDAVQLHSYDPANLMAAIKEFPNDYFTFSEHSTDYVQFLARDSVFADSRVRRAFALAVDRKKLEIQVSKGFNLPATGGYLPHDFPGYSEGIGLHFDPIAARELLSEAGFADGANFPKAEFIISESKWQLETAKYLREEWIKVLGINLKFTQVAKRIYENKMSNSEGDMAIVGMGTGYPDPNDFLSATNWQEYNTSFFEDRKKFFKLTKQAKVERDPQKRISLYQEADRILIDEALIIPFAYGMGHRLYKPWIGTTYFGFGVSNWYKDRIIFPH